MSFEAEVYGKWILVGEHSVLRGMPALVFPLRSRGLKFSFLQTPNSKGLHVAFTGSHGSELELLFWGVFEKACELKKVFRQDIKGQVSIDSNLPVGAGLGASAALSASVARWFEHLKILKSTELLEFARNLENLFHGESSGVDLAVALSGQALKFTRGQSLGPQLHFYPQWQPQWFLSYSGQRGMTIDCVKRVKKLLMQDPALGAKLDQDMREAVLKAEKALLTNHANSLSELAQAINLANSCFEAWGLNEGTPGQQLEVLRQRGALAVKPTGSGQGGYLLSLWGTEPPAELRVKMITL